MRKFRSTGPLRVGGDAIVDPEGNRVVLRGVGLGALADSFALARCVTRTRLCELLASRTGTAAGQA